MRNGQSGLPQSKILDADDFAAYTSLMTVRTRFAPSPTGYLHVGGARTALFNWLFARRHGGVFVLRVEDTDEARNTEEARQAIFDGMKWLGLDWDEGPFYQSERREIYDAWFAKLEATGRVYEDGGAWRFRFERKPVTMQDLVCGEVTIDYRDESNTPDMVVKRSDGSYVFHFVNVVDDLEMEITHVIRGEDHLMNTPKHLQLIEALGGKAPQYAHIPLILNPDGSKMSKRDAGAAVGDYPRLGFLSSAVVNFIALLGWNPKTEREIFTLSDLAHAFSLENVNRSPARFDLEKCKWMNQQHIQLFDEDEFASVAQDFVDKEFYGINDSSHEHYVGKWVLFKSICKLIQPRTTLFSEVDRQLKNFTTYERAIDISVPTGTQSMVKGLTYVRDRLLQCNKLSTEDAKLIISEGAANAGIKPGQLMLPLRLALTNDARGPDVGAILSSFGPSLSGQYIENFTQDYYSQFLLPPSSPPSGDQKNLS